MKKVETIEREETANVIFRKLTDYFRLLKFRLSLVVVFSSIFGYMMAPGIDGFSIMPILLLSLGGFLVTGASNTLNQIIEADYDRLMTRTAKRPLARQSLAPTEALIYAMVMGIGGIFLMWFQFGIVAGLLSIIALISYAFVYTPLKRVSTVGVFVGAFPGAMPPLIGWAAATGSVSWEASILFLIQFIWQFPHFWAIAWVLDDDYKKAGFKMLPNGGRTYYTAMLVLLYTAMLIPVWILPYSFNMTGGIATIVMVAVSALFLVQAFILTRKLSKSAALQLMFGSFLYLPIIQIGMLIDKFL